MPKSKSHQKICFVADEVKGPRTALGLEEGLYSLAKLLVAQGHSVTLFSMRPPFRGAVELSHWTDHYASLGIDVVVIPNCPHKLYGLADAKTSYRAFHWLKDKNFDVVHFRGDGHVAYFSLLAKKQGLAFANTQFCVSVHHPALWLVLFDQRVEWDAELLGTDYMERRSVELADSVVCSSRYILDWMRSENWKLPDDICCLEDLRDPIAGVPQPERLRSQAFTEITFLGRFGWREGLSLFCDAIDHLGPDLEKRGVQVSFIGQTFQVAGETSLNFLYRRALRWSLPPTYLVNLSVEEQINYLKSRNVLVVIPSLSESFSTPLAMCLAEKIKFIAADVGGLPELIHPENRSQVLFSPDTSSLVERIRTELETGFSGLPSRALLTSQKKLTEAWLKLYSEIGSKSASVSVKQPQWSPNPSGTPRVSVCIAHRNRPATLRIVLESLRRQEFQDFEVILVDDGSDSPAALAFLDELEQEFATTGWRLIRQKHLYSGATRNTAARVARGEYLVFMDDDNEAEPFQLRVFDEVARRTGADILTCFVNHVEEKERLPDRAIPKDCPVLWVPLGGAAAVGYFWNAFGDTNAYIKRTVFEALNGFTEDFGVGHDDWEFFAKAALAGYDFQVIPRPLFWYRRHAFSITGQTGVYENSLRTMRPYREAVPPSLQSLLWFCQRRQGLYWQPRIARANTLTVDPKRSEAVFFTETAAPVGVWNYPASFEGLEILGALAPPLLGETLRFEAANEDPNILIPLPQFEFERELWLQVDMEVPLDTRAEVFYLVDGENDYSASRKIAKVVHSGRSQVLFKLPRMAVRGPLRLDPGDCPGRYEIHHLEIRSAPLLESD